MMPLEDQLEHIEYQLEAAREAGNPNHTELLLQQRQHVLTQIKDTRTTR